MACAFREPSDGQAPLARQRYRRATWPTESDQSPSDGNHGDALASAFDNCCLVQVRWDSYSKAKAKFLDIVHESFSTNCATTMDIGSQPANPEAPHQAVVIFECEQARLKGLGASN